MVYQFVMNRKNVIPLYMQISSILIRDISARRYADGDRLPPERALAKSLNVTVTTLRKSLKDLEKKGFLIRKQGSGNYVSVKGVDDSLYSFFRLERLEGGGLPRAELLSVDHLEKPEDLPHFGTAQEGFRFRRRRFLNELPIAVEEIWLDGDCAKSIKTEEVLPSLYLFYRKKLGQWIIEAEDSVSVSQYPDWADYDEIFSPQKTCGYIERQSWNQDGLVIEYSRTWYAPERAKYISRIK